MKFGDIFPLLLVLLILYYAAMIAMDLYKARLEKEAEKEKNTEEEIDISDEAATFQPIRIRRDDPKKPIVPASAESPRNETEDKNKDKANTDAPSKNEEKRPEAPKDNERTNRYRIPSLLHHPVHSHRIKGKSLFVGR